MKKKGLFALCLALVALFALAACSSQGGIRKNFENEGYDVKTVKYEDLGTTKAAVKLIFNQTDEETLNSYEFVTATKGLNIATFVAFPSAGDLEKALTYDGDKSAYETAKENGSVHGNCLLIIATTDAAKDIFNK